MPRVETLADMRKRPVSAANNRAVLPLFEGTLIYGRRIGRCFHAGQRYGGWHSDRSTADKAQMMLASGKISEGVLKMWQG